MTSIRSVSLAPSAVSLDTASAAGPDTRGFRSSGQSPGSSVAGKTVHLIGPGKVGRSFLQLLAGQPFRLVAVTDQSGTVYERAGLDGARIAAHKAAGGRIAELPRAEAIPGDVAAFVIGADVVVDATSSDAASTDAALARGRSALRSGAHLLLAGKNALAVAAPEWLLGVHRGRVGINAVLGGTGAHLLADLEELRAHCRELLLCGNVTTTVIIEAIERGASVDEGIAHAQRLGVLESDPTLDLDGSDAAVKLAAVWGAVFAPRAAAATPLLTSIARQDVRGLDAQQLRARASRGATTRLVGRGSRRGGDLRVQFEEVERSSPLAAPPDRVVYGYGLPAGLRVHTGFGVGYAATAAALLQDLLTVEARR
jgi:homoserine dehydrogenase